MRSSSLQLQKRREAEMAAARTSEEVYALMDRWHAEDDAHARAASAEGQRIATLERRLAAVERVLGPELMRAGSLIDAIGAVVARHRQETKAQIEKEFTKRQPMTHRGIWSPEVDYQPGHVVTHGGAAWSARIESRGSRPGQDGVWRLIAKGSGS